MKLFEWHKYKQKPGRPTRWHYWPVSIGWVGNSCHAFICWHGWPMDGSSMYPDATATEIGGRSGVGRVCDDAVDITQTNDPVDRVRTKTVFSEKRKMSTPVQPIVMPRLINRGDGVNGHFCIGRSRDGVFYEFWSDRSGWCSAGTVYVGQDVAEAKLKEVTK